MPKLLFTDEQKATLAKEAGITGVPDTNTFDKEYDPSTGEQKLYMKLGTSGKFFGSKPATVKLQGEDALNAQVDYVKSQYGGKTMQDIYGAMIATTPSDKAAIRDKIAAGPGGIGSQLEGITQQIQNLQKLKAGNQSEIFNAIDPKTGQPIDPRVAVAAFQNRQKSFTEQENNLRALEDMYNAQLGALTDSEYSRQAAENKKNETALGYLKDLESQKTADEKLATDKAQYDAKLAEEKRQFNITNGISDPANNIPVAVDEITSYVQKSRGTDLVQCGALGNDYWKLKTGTSLGVGDTYDSKVKAIEKVGKSAAPVEGGVFTFPLKTSMGDTGHFGIVKSVNSDGTIEVLEANREGSPKGGKMVTHTYSADAVKKMTFSVAPQGNTQTAPEKMPKTFGEFVKVVPIPDADITDEQVKQMIDKTKTAFPEEKDVSVANALLNRAPEKTKASIQRYIDGIIQKEGESTMVSGLIAKIPELTESTTKTLVRSLENSGKDPTTIVDTLYKAGFFDEFGPWSLTSWGNDDQWEVVRDYAAENDLDVNTILEEIKKKGKNPTAK